MFKSKLFQLIVAVVLWGLFVKRVVSNTSGLGQWLNNLGYKMLPNGLAGMPGPTVLLIILTILYFALVYFAVFKSQGNDD